jgi:hypothetical protein
MVSLFLSNLFAKVQKVFGFTSGKEEKFGLGQEKAVIVVKLDHFRNNIGCRNLRLPFANIL